MSKFNVFKLENVAANSEVTASVAGIKFARGITFADDGFGNFISTDLRQSVFSAVEGMDLNA